MGSGVLLEDMPRVACAWSGVSFKKDSRPHFLLVSRPAEDHRLSLRGVARKRGALKWAQIPDAEPSLSRGAAFDDRKCLTTWVTGRLGGVWAPPRGS